MLDEICPARKSDEGGNGRCNGKWETTGLACNRERFTATRLYDTENETGSGERFALCSLQPQFSTLCSMPSNGNIIY